MRIQLLKRESTADETKSSKDSLIGPIPNSSVRVAQIMMTDLKERGHSGDGDDLRGESDSGSSKNITNPILR
jgi:hypothetical protein